VCDVDVDTVERSPKQQKWEHSKIFHLRLILRSGRVWVTLVFVELFAVGTWWLGNLSVNAALDQFTKTPTEFPILPFVCAGGETQQD